MLKYCLFCVMYFCGSFNNLIHFLFPNEDLLPAPFLIGAMYPLTVFPLVFFSHEILFFCWSFQLQSKEIIWPVENLVPWKSRPFFFVLSL